VKAKRAFQNSRNQEQGTVWATSVLGGGTFPDHRLKLRAIQILAQKATRPGDSIPQGAGCPAAAKGTYRFVENPRVSAKLFWSPIHEHAARALRGVDRALAIQDTTFLNLPTLEATEGLGTVNGKDEEALLMHSVLAVRPDGHILGMLDNQVWARPPEEFGKAKDRKSRPIEEKESSKWLRGMRRAATLRDRLSPGTRLLHVCDREADIHEVFQEAIDLGDDAIVRCSRDRKVEGEWRYVRATLAAQPVLARARIEVPRKKGERKRWAAIEIRSATVTLDPPAKYPGRRPLTLGVVWVNEPVAPEGVEPLEWMPWTTLPVGTVEEALTVVEFYRRRWRIEDFHRTLKEGCRVERTQLKTAGRIETLVAYSSAVAVRLLQITHWARTEPTRPCTEVLSDEEWRVLWARIHNARLAEGQGPPTSPMMWAKVSPRGEGSKPLPTVGERRGESCIRPAQPRAVVPPLPLPPGSSLPTS
jgi:hypothetical protein